MKSYFALVIKKLFRDRTVYKMVFLCIAVILGIYCMNLQANPTDDYQFRAVREYRHNTNMAANSSDPGLKELYQRFADRYGEILEDLKQEDYVSMYDTQLAILREQQEMTPHMEGAKQIEMIENLQKENLLQDSFLYPVMAVPFLVQCFESLFPYLAVLLNCFILTCLYTDRYKDRVDKDSVIPISRNSAWLCDLFVGIGCSAGVFVLLAGIAWLFAGVIGGFSSFRYPYAYYQGTEMVYRGAGEFAVPVITLYLLYAVFTSLTVGMVGRLVRRRTGTLFVSAAILLGIGYMTQVIEPLHSIAHLMPTSYYTWLCAASGYCTRYLYQNGQMTFSAGRRVLCMAIVCLSCITVFMNSRSR